MQKSKILLFSLYCLVGALIFISCQKDNSITEEQNIDVNIIDGTVDTPPSVSIEEQATSGVVIIKDILMVIFQQSLLQPELWGLQGEPSADLRTDCPNSVLSGTAPNLNLNLYFTDCAAVDSTGSNPADQPVFMDGRIRAKFTDEMFVDDDIVVTIFENFKIGDFTVSDSNGGNIGLNLRLNANGAYVIDTPRDITFTHCTTGDMTVYAANENIGNFKLTDGGVPSIPSNPLTYLDDQIGLRLDNVEVECITAGGTSVSEVSLKTGGDRLILNPFSCGCITDGTINITGDETSTLDFGVDMSGAQSDPADPCNEYVSVDGVAQPMLSCD